MIRILSQVFVGAFFAVLAGSAAAQMYGGHFQDVADTKAVPTQAGGDTTPPPAPAEAKGATKSKASKSHSASKSSSHHAHAVKSTNKSSRANAEPPVAPEENAYRQALRGCATQPDQAQRDSCLDSAI